MSKPDLGEITPEQLVEAMWDGIGPAVQKVLVGVRNHLVATFASDISRQVTSGDLSPEARMALAGLANRLDSPGADQAEEILEELTGLRQEILPEGYEEMKEGRIPMSQAGFATWTIDQFLDERVTDISVWQLMNAARP